MKIKTWITNNVGLKILSLFLSVATWFYISWEFGRLKDEEERAIFSMLHYDVTSKILPIQLTIIGEAKEGHEVVNEGISLEPRTSVVIGPKKIMDDVNVVRTVPIDISGQTKNIDVQVELAPIASGIAPKGDFVKVHIPIAKKEGVD